MEREDEKPEQVSEDDELTAALRAPVSETEPEIIEIEDPAAVMPRRALGYTALRWREPVVIFAPVVFLLATFGLVAGGLWLLGQYAPTMLGSLTLAGPETYLVPVAAVGGKLALITGGALLLTLGREVTLTMLMGFCWCLSLIFAGALAVWMLVTGSVVPFLPEALSGWLETVQPMQRYFFYYILCSMTGIILGSVSFTVMRYLGYTTRV